MGLRVCASVYLSIYSSGKLRELCDCGHGDAHQTFIGLCQLYAK